MIKQGTSRKWLLSGLLLAGFGLTAQPVLATDQFQLSDYKGRIVYLDFWASWCKPCVKSFPFMNQLKSKFEQRGLVVIAVNVDVDRGRAEQFLENHPADFEIVFDTDGEISSEYEIQAMPTSFLFNRNGELIGSHFGFKQEDTKVLEATISASLDN